MAALLAQGLANKTIAARLGISENAVAVHRSRLKLGATRRSTRVVSTRLPLEVEARLRMEADARGLGVSQLAGRLLRLVVTDGMVAAVLDDEGSFA